MCSFQEGGVLPVSASAIAVPGETHGPDGSKVAYEVPRPLETEEIPGVVASVGARLSFCVSCVLCAVSACVCLCLPVCLVSCVL